MRKGLIISVVYAGCAWGQTGSTGPKPFVINVGGDPAQFGAVGMTTALAVPMGNVTGAPYSAQVITERVQVLADGNRIVQTTSGTVARDSQGRVRRDEGLPALASSSGDAPHIVMIEDPVAQVHWTLDAATKTAMKLPTAGRVGIASALGVPPPPGAAGRTWFYSSAAPPPIAAGKIQIMTNILPQNDASASEADLGTQTMEGVSAQGKRTTRTIAAGQIGNEQPIVITTETWYSPGLKVLVMSKSNDPRMGETTYKLTAIQLAEPPASLFQVPEDYAVKDQAGMNFVYQETKKVQ